MIPAGAILAAYLLGSVPFGFLIGRMLKGIDVRAHGSGNIGATNVWRIAGAGCGLATGLLDLGKGWLAVELTGWVNPSCSAWWQVAAAVAAVAGHNWTVWLGFRGEKEC